MSASKSPGVWTISLQIKNMNLAVGPEPALSLPKCLAFETRETTNLGPLGRPVSGPRNHELQNCESDSKILITLADYFSRARTIESVANQRRL